MEEKNKTKEVKMSVEGGDNSQQKYTYEQLNEICGKLFNENQYLRQQHQKTMEAVNTINRLDYLLRVIEIESRGKGGMFSSDFLIKSAEEVEKILTIPAEEEKEDSKNN